LREPGSARRGAGEQDLTEVHLALRKHVGERDLTLEAGTGFRSCRPLSVSRRRGFHFCVLVVEFVGRDCSHMPRWPAVRAVAPAVGAGLLMLAAVQLLVPPQRTSLVDWGELGSGLDDDVPQQLNAGAANIGGVLVRKHQPSGRMPGWGGGSHFLSDGIVSLRRDIKHDLGFRRSPRAQAMSILRRQQRARSLARARAVLRRERQHERLSEREHRAARVHLQQMAMRQRSAEQHPDDDITEATLQRAYARASRLALKKATVARSGQGKESSGKEGGTVTPDEVTQAYRKAASIAQNAQSSVTSAGAVGAKTASVLDKAAKALETITDSLNSGSFNADPDRMSKMASSLAALSQALGTGKGLLKGGRDKDMHSMRASSGGTFRRSSGSGQGAAVSSREAAVAGAVRQREEKIEEDILYHLGKLRLLPEASIHGTSDLTKNIMAALPGGSDGQGN
jgi:hypothetical protein